MTPSVSVALSLNPSVLRATRTQGCQEISLEQWVPNQFSPPKRQQANVPAQQPCPPLHLLLLCPHNLHLFK